MSGYRDGVRKRLASIIHGNTGEEPGEQDEANGPPLKGGVRRRLGIGSRSSGQASASSDDHAPRRHSIKRDLHEEVHPDASIPKGPLNNKLVSKWLSGKNKSNEVFELGSAASAQGATDMGKLANESSTKNASRDLKRSVAMPAEAPPIDFINLPGVQNQAICCPVNYFESLACGDEDRFSKVLLGKPGANINFWEQLQGQPTCPEDVDSRTLALGVHGDGAAITNTQGLFTISWNSLHASDVQTQENRCIFACIRKSLIQPGTLEKVFDRLAWSLNALSTGKLPERDWKGKRLKNAGHVLAQGWKGKCIQVRGDWEFYCQALQFPSPTSVPCMCWRCRASPEGRLRWTAVDDHAEWRRTLQTHATYLARLVAEGRELPSLFKVLDLKLEGVMIDVLHTVDQGVASHLIANVLCEVCDLLPGSTQKERAKVLNEMLIAWYKEHKHHHKIDGELTWTTLKSSGDWPKLKAKAAATRHMMDFAREQAAKYNSGSDHDQKRLACCDLLQRFYGIIKEEGEFLTFGAKREIRVLGNRFVQIYLQLASEALANNERMWKMSPKFHLFIHVCELSHINPRYTWCYADEDLQKHVKHIALGCHPTTVDEICLYKWLVRAFSDR